MHISTQKLLTLIFLICLSCFGCGQNAPVSNSNGNASANASPQTTEKSEANSQADVKGEAYPQPIVDEFMNGCQKAGSDETFCQCVFEKVEKGYSLSEFAEIEAKIKQGSPPEEFVEFTRKARSECQK